MATKAVAPVRGLRRAGRRLRGAECVEVRPPGRETRPGSAAEHVVERLRVAVVLGQRGKPERRLDRSQQAVVRVADVGDEPGADCGGPEDDRGHELRRVLVVIGILVEGDDRQRPLRAPGRRDQDAAQRPREEAIAGPDPASLHVVAVVGPHPGEVGRGRGAGQVCLHFLKRDVVGRAVRGAVAHLGEVQERQIVVPVVAVDGVVTRSGGVLQVGLPRLVGGVDQVSDLAGPDREARIDLQGIGEWDPEHPAGRQREVVAVAGVLLGEQIRQKAGVRQEAVQIRGLPPVADHRAQALVLEHEHEHVVKPRDVGGGWRQPRRRFHRRADREAQPAGDRSVVSGDRSVGAVEVPERRHQADDDPRCDRAVGNGAGNRPARERGLARASNWPDDRVSERCVPCREERGGHRRCAGGGPAQPAGQAIARSAAQRG